MTSNDEKTLKAIGEACAKTMTPFSLMKHYNDVCSKNAEEACDIDSPFVAYATALAYGFAAQQEDAATAAQKRKDGCKKTRGHQLEGVLRVTVSDAPCRGPKPSRVVLVTEEGEILLSVVSPKMMCNNELYIRTRALDGQKVSVHAHVWPTETGLRAYVTSSKDVTRFKPKAPKPRTPGA